LAPKQALNSECFLAESLFRYVTIELGKLALLIPEGALYIMRWIVFFEDTPEMLSIRREWEPDHLAYLRKHSDEILLAGGCREEPGQAYVGGLWVLDVPSRERVVELIESDPYYSPDRRSYKIRTWGKAFSDTQVIL
jgi:uncharacterized protein YciI